MFPTRTKPLPRRTLPHGCSSAFSSVVCRSQGGSCDPTTQNDAGGTPGSKILWVVLGRVGDSVLSRVFRGKFLGALKRHYRRHKRLCAGPTLKLADSHEFHRLIRSLYKKDWVVYAKPAFGDPIHVLRYLGRYTHRVGHFQSSLTVFRWRASHLPMEGLRTRQSAKTHDAERGRVPASILSPCSTQRICMHSPLRLSGESVSL